MLNTNRFRKQLFIPQNPNKIIGKKQIIARSSYEYKLMLFLDSNPNVLEWASESLSIKYMNPVTGRITKYYPDFLVKFKIPGSEETFIEMIEIKPLSQTQPPKLSKNKKKKTIITETKTWLINQAKWDAAKHYCDSAGIVFKIYTEKDLGITR